VGQFGLAMRRARKELGLTQPWVADKAGVSVPMVSQVEGGKREPSVGIAIKMIKALVGRALGGNVTRIALVGATRDGRPQFEIEWEREGNGYKQRITSPRPLLETLGIGGTLGVSQRTELRLLAEVLTLAMGPPRVVKEIAARIGSGG